MVSDKKTLLSNYRDSSFTMMNKSLYHQYYYYMLILFGFSIMFISVLLRFNYLVFNYKNIILVITILFPVIYLLIKSFKGLILLNDSYQEYHYRLIRQFLILYIWGYNILISSILGNFFTTSIIYLLQSLIIYSLAYFFYYFTRQYKRYKIIEDVKKFHKGLFFDIEKYNPLKEMIIFSICTSILLIIGFQILIVYFELNLFYYLLTYLFMIVICYIYFYDSYNEPYILLEIDLLHLGLKNCPEDTIGSLHLN